MSSQPFVDRAECAACAITERCLFSKYWSDLASVSKRGLQAKHFGPRQVLVCEGQHAAEIWFVRSGLLLCSRVDQQGNEVPTGIHTAGSAIGLLESFTTSRRFRTTITSLTPSVLCSVTTEELRQLQNTNTSVCEAIADVLEHEREFLSTYGVALLGQSVKVRLLRLLLELRHPFGEVREDGVLHMHLPVPRNVLASIIGTTPETLSRTVKELQESSVLLFEGAKVLIPDLDIVLDIVEKTSTP
ncbi:MAG: Crp/Fnr family transcriptional regulator [Polyangiaceae bacterium]